MYNFIKACSLICIIIIGSVDSVAFAGLDCTKKRLNTFDFLARDIIVVGKKYFIVDSNGRILSTIKGKDFKISIVDKTKFLKGISWNGNVFVVSSLRGNIYRSFDSEEWELVHKNSSSRIIGIFSNGQEFIVADATGTLFIGNKDANNWDKVILPLENMVIKNIVWLRDHYLLIADGFYESVDGREWRKIADKGEVPNGFMAYNNDKYVIAGLDNKIYYSNDLIHWNIAKKIIDKIHFTNISWTGKEFIITGNCGFLSMSVDAKQWQTKRMKYLPNIKAATSNGVSFIVIGEPTEISGAPSTILFSKNADKWQEISSKVPVDKKTIKHRD